MTCFMPWMEAAHSISFFSIRVGASLLTNAGFPGLVAQTPDDYVDRAATLAADISDLANQRSTMRARIQKSILTDAPRCARAFESSLRDVWQNWCEQHPDRAG